MYRFATSGIAGMTFALALMPALASADTVSDLQSQIQTLLSQLKTLQTQLWQAKASSTVATTTPNGTGTALGKRCVELREDLREGHRGDDVKKLQKFLREHPESGFTSSDTGFFGPATKKAMKKFAEKNGMSNLDDSSLRSVFMRDCIQDIKGIVGMNTPNEARGSVASVTGTTFTVTLPGTTTPRTVVTNASTTIRVFATATTTTPAIGTFADISVGKVVKVEGLGQTDKSLLAREIKVYPAGTLVKTEDKGFLSPLKNLFKKDNSGRDHNEDD